MGGAVNIPSPRRGQTDVDLTQPVETDTSLAEPLDAEPSGPMTTQGADVATLLRYHRRLSRVANEAVDHPDLQDEALRRIEGVLAEFDNQGVPREVVDLELAKTRYTEAQLELDQMRKQYRNTLRTDPSRAQAFLNKARTRSQELQALEGAYGS